MKRSADSEQLLGMLHQAIIPPARPSLVLLAWRWRYEMAMLAGLLLTVVALVETLGLNGTILFAVTAVTIMLTVLIAWPAACHRLTARAWCVLIPHRLRAGCAQARIHTRRGRLPAILWCAPKGYGEQVFIWCPAGVTIDDFAAARQLLATACYAAEIEVVTHPRYRNLVILRVVRYQPSDSGSPDDVATRLGVHFNADSDADLVRPTPASPPVARKRDVNQPIPVPRPKSDNGVSAAREQRAQRRPRPQEGTAMSDPRP